MANIKNKPDVMKKTQPFQNRPHSSGFKSFLNWFKKVEKLQREQDKEPNDSSLSEVSSSSSLSSNSSTATVSSFAFLDPNYYKPFGEALQPEKFIESGPYTDTYNRLILDREKRRKIDKNVSIRKKYDLYSSGTTLNGTLKSNQNVKKKTNDKTDNRSVYETFSLPAMNKSTNIEFRNKEHRRAASETKFERPLSYVHVKGKRKAPLPPTSYQTNSLRKKRIAPLPPTGNNEEISTNKIDCSSEASKPKLFNSKSHDAVSKYLDISPKPWYKRQLSDSKYKNKKVGIADSFIKHKNEPEVGFFRYSKLFDSRKNSHNLNKNNEKNITGLQILSNLSEFNSEPISNTQTEENNNYQLNLNIHGCNNPRSARNLITKFNAMNNPNSGKRTGAIGEQLNTNVAIEKSENLSHSKITNEINNLRKVNTTQDKFTEWFCIKCKSLNKPLQLKCHICLNNFTSHEESLVNPSSNLLDSFETEVFSALSHLGRMGDKVEVESMIEGPHSKLTDRDIEKQKLKELLKEMKNSLPKKQKLNTKFIMENNDHNISTVSGSYEPTKIVLANNDALSNSINYETHQIGEKSEIQNVKLIPKTLCPKSDAYVQTNISNNSKPIEKFQELYTNLDIQRIQKPNEKMKNIKSESGPNSCPKHLLKQLEVSIGNGDDLAAAEIAKKLALLKVNCTVLGSLETNIIPHDYKLINVFIEDQDSHHGPVPMKIKDNCSIGDLKMEVYKELRIPTNIQRWIIGKQLAIDNTKTITNYNDGNFAAPMFLYLVATDKRFFNVDTKNNESSLNVDGTGVELTLKDQIIMPSTSMGQSKLVDEISVQARTYQNKENEHRPHYVELLNLENQELINNIELFECSVCFLECAKGKGVVLRECLHNFCRDCLVSTIKFSEEASVKCPYRDYQYSCEGTLQEREIKALVCKEAFEQHLAKSVSVAENSMQKTFHCKTADCRGWCIYEDNVNYFKCPICEKMNCLTCQAIHEDENCKQYQERIELEKNPENSDGLRTKQMLDDMIKRGDALTCPSCQVVLMKKWGCDWVRCSMCKTEICWVTRGFRWGPTGKGDTSAGCQCGLNGVKCHPKCNYCH